MDKLFLYLGYPFVRHAILVGALVALCASLLGVILVLKRFSFIGDGLSHVAFGAMVVATVAGISNNMIVILPTTMVCASLLLGLNRRLKTNGDVLIAIVSVFALALGYLLMNIFSTSVNLYGDVCTTLFGSTSILTLSKGEVMLCVFLSLAVVVFFVIFYNKLFCITFDSEFSKSVGTNVDLYNMMLAVFIAVVICVAMKLVGSLLVTALVVFPAVSSMRLFEGFKRVVISSCILSVLCALTGIIISILAGLPIGSMIVVVDAIVFLICCIIGKVLRG